MKLGASVRMSGLGTAVSSSSSEPGEQFRRAVGPIVADRVGGDVDGQSFPETTDGGGGEPGGVGVFLVHHAVDGPVVLDLV